VGSPVSERRTTMRSDVGFVVDCAECRDLLVPVEVGADEEEEEVEGAKNGQEPEEVVEAAPVEVVDEPGLPAPVVARDAVHHRDQHGAQEVAARDGAQVHRRAQAPHPLRRLTVEKLQLPNLRKNLRAPPQKVLRHKPENRNGHRHLRLVQKPMCLCHIHPLHLHGAHTKTILSYLHRD
jgi:hypothetical protein